MYRFSTMRLMSDVHKLIKDEHAMFGAWTEYGNPIRVYDDGFGPVWICRDTMGIVGLVRAQDMETALELVEQEFLPEAEETVEELVQEFGSPESETWQDNPCFQEQYGFRPSGPREGNWESGEPRDPLGHGIFVRDLNGCSLEILTRELQTELRITISAPYRRP